MPAILIGVVALIAVVAVVSINALRGGTVEPTPTVAPIVITEEVTAVAAGMPNLQIANIRSAPSRPAPGQVFRLLISIRNDGTSDSGDFNWTWDASPVLRNALEGRVESIPPGATRNISFPYSYGWWGSYSSQIIVDADSEVDETDERDNREAAIVELDPDSEFDIDFTLLPNNEIVSPPRNLGPLEFLNWKLAFSVSATDDNAECGNTPFAIIELGNANALATAENALPACATLPMVIKLSDPVRQVNLQLAPSSEEDIILKLFTDSQGQELAFESEPLATQSGETIELGADDDFSGRIRRIEIDSPSQSVNLTRITLFPILD
jgi:hypothetical protein